MKSYLTMLREGKSKYILLLAIIGSLITGQIWILCAIPVILGVKLYEYTKQKAVLSEEEIPLIEEEEKRNKNNTRGKMQDIAQEVQKGLCKAFVNVGRKAKDSSVSIAELYDGAIFRDKNIYFSNIFNFLDEKSQYKIRGNELSSEFGYTNNEWEGFSAEYKRAIIAAKTIEKIESGEIKSEEIEVALRRKIEHYARKIIVRDKTDEEITQLYSTLRFYQKPHYNTQSLTIKEKREAIISGKVTIPSIKEEVRKATGILSWGWLLWYKNSGAVGITIDDIPNDTLVRFGYHAGNYEASAAVMQRMKECSSTEKEAIKKVLKFINEIDEKTMKKIREVMERSASSDKVEMKEVEEKASDSAMMIEDSSKNSQVKGGVGAFNKALKASNNDEIQTTALNFLHSLPNGNNIVAQVAERYGNLNSVDVVLKGYQDGLITQGQLILGGLSYIIEIGNRMAASLEGINTQMPELIGSMNAVREEQSNIASKIDGVRTDLSAVRTENADIKAQNTHLTNRVETLGSTVDNMSADMKRMMQMMEYNMKMQIRQQRKEDELDENEEKKLDSQGIGR